jgi:hypothetical protein
VRTQFGLDRPLTTQYVDWLGRAVQLDFGKSFYFQGPVMEMISERLPITFKLGGSALLLAILTAIPLGVLAALTGYLAGPHGAAHCRGRAGHAQLLVRADTDPHLRRHAALAAGGRRRAGNISSCPPWRWVTTPCRP